MAFSVPQSKAQYSALRDVDAHLDRLDSRLKRKRGIREIKREIDFVQATFTRRDGLLKQFADMSARFCIIMDVNSLTYDERWTKISILVEEHLHSVRSLVERKDLEFSISYFDHEDYIGGIETMLEKIRRYINRCEANQHNASQPRPSRRRIVHQPVGEISEPAEIIEIEHYLPAVPPSTSSALPAPSMPLPTSRPPVPNGKIVNNPNVVVDETPAVSAPQAQQQYSPRPPAPQAPQQQHKPMTPGQRNYIIDLIDRSRKSTIDNAYKSINKTPADLEALSSREASALIELLSSQSPASQQQQQYSPASQASDKSPDELVLKTFVSRGGEPINGYNGHIFTELREYILSLPSHQAIINDINNCQDDLSNLTFADWAYSMYAPDRSKEADDQDRQQRIRQVLQRTRQRLDDNRRLRHEADEASLALEAERLLQQQQVITQDMRDQADLGNMESMSSIVSRMIQDL